MDPKNQIQLSNRSRAYAITHSTRRLFQEIQIWDDLINKLTLFNKLSIEYREISTRLHLYMRDLSDSNQKFNAIGWILDHKQFMDVVIPHLEESRFINLLLVSKFSENTMDYDLIFVARSAETLDSSLFCVYDTYVDYCQEKYNSKTTIARIYPDLPNTPINIRQPSPHTLERKFKILNTLGLTLPTNKPQSEIRISMPKNGTTDVTKISEVE